MRAKFGRGPTAVSKKVSFNFISKVGGQNKAHTLEKNAYKIQFHKD